MPAAASADMALNLLPDSEDAGTMRRQVIAAYIMMPLDDMPFAFAYIRHYHDDIPP